MTDALRFKQQLSAYRTYLMGFSILWIVFHHVGFFGLCSFTAISDFVIKLGSCGVDVFLILSAFGSYNSLSKNFNICQFYKRRIIRIIPAFVIIVLGFHVKHLVDSLSLYFWINELLCNWYIGFIIIAYLFYPLIFLVQKRFMWMPFLIGCTIGGVGTVLLVIYNMDDIHQVPMLMIQRVPVFCLGSLIADDRFKFSLRYCYLALSMVLVAIYFSFVKNVEYLVYPLYMLLMIPFLSCLSCLLQKMLTSNMKLMKWGGQFLHLSGLITLELYLVHMKVIPILVRHNINGLQGLIVMFACSILLACFVHKFCSLQIFMHCRVNNR